ncbi:MAG: PQQ-dependent sugar dehydrogenase [Pseudomonadota bacterium]
MSQPRFCSRRTGPAMLAVLTLVVLGGCGSRAQLPVAAGTGPDPQLPPPSSGWFPTVNIAPAVGWPENARPEAMTGATVTAFARGLDHPRWLHVLPNGDVLVAESNAPEKPGGRGGIRGWIMRRVMERAGAAVPSADRITLLRDTDGDGVADERHVLLDDLYSPFGMALVGNDLYVANTDAIVRFPYRAGQTRIDAAGETLTELPAGPINHHWTKNIIAGPDDRYLYATVGSNSNIAENGMTAEYERAAILQVTRDSGAHRVYASGLRNPNGLAWVPETGALWTAVNERDGLGGDLVPDYMTTVQRGGFYGWPYSYFGGHVDERVEPQDPDAVASALTPDYALGPHTASLGLAYATEHALAAELGPGMFVGQHGSWNRDPRSGYKVIFVPFENGEPAGMPVDVLTSFLTEDGEARGRPAGVAMARDGALLVADDVGNAVWRVTAAP